LENLWLRLSAVLLRRIPCAEEHRVDPNTGVKLRVYSGIDLSAHFIIVDIPLLYLSNKLL
tara:strand:- start:79 stop:258 length:180 start_codon:yes stop_codon:yes gene_type:complete